MSPHVLLNTFKENISNFVNTSKNINNSSEIYKNRKDFIKNIATQNNNPSFLMKAEKMKINNTQNIIQNPVNIPISQKIEKNTVKSDYVGLEEKVESINEKLNRLENRVDKDEKITMTTQSDIKDLKSNLDKNFNKLDTILEKLATKLK